MRQEFCKGVTRYKAQKQCPWAVKIIKVEGGYMAFESWTDFHVFINR